MRIAINLATRPYVELDRLLLRLRIALGVLAVLAIALGIWLHSMTARAAEQQRQMAALNAQANRLQAERAANEARLRQPVNASTLSRNQFLNTLFVRKSFSWTAVLMDLEEVLPTGVQVASIEPVLSATGDVTIRLRVLGDRERTVLFVKNLETSKRFIAPRLAGEAQQTAEKKGTQTLGANGLPQLTVATGAAGLPPIAGVEFEIVSGYNPLQPRVREKIAPHTKPATDAAKSGDSKGGEEVRLPSGVTVPDERRQQLRGLASTLNLHIAGAVVLALVCAYLGVQLYLTSSKTGTAGDEALVIAQSRVAAAEVAAKPLRGVDAKLAASEDEAAKFYKERLPYAYSDVLTELGSVAKKTNVRLSRASYVQAVPADDLTELRIDASVTGEYVPLAHFVNDLERNKSFFLIENVALSGAQNGLVNLQMRIGTWIREPMPASAGVQAGSQP